MRILLDFDEVTAIRTFDPLDQGSTGDRDSVRIAPCREVSFGEEMRADRVRRAGGAGLRQETRSTRRSPRCSMTPRWAAAELFFPLCFPRQFSLLDYLGPGARVSLVDERSAGIERRSAAQGVPGALPQGTLEEAGRAGAAEDPAGPRQLLCAGRRAGRLPRAPRRGRGSPDRSPDILRFPATVRGRSSATSRSSAKRWRPSLKNGYQVFIFAVYDVQAEQAAPHPQGPARHDPAAEHLRRASPCPADEDPRHPGSGDLRPQAPHPALGGLGAKRRRSRASWSSPRATSSCT